LKQHKSLGVLYNRFYVCELLRNLGLSRQKARFVSDHLDEEARKQQKTFRPSLAVELKQTSYLVSQSGIYERLPGRELRMIYTQCCLSKSPMRTTKQSIGIQNNV
jgi:hypothetical protein